MKAFSAMRRDRYSGWLQIQTAFLLSQSAKIDKQKPSILGLYNSVGFYVFRSLSFQKLFICIILIVTIWSCIFIFLLQNSPRQFVFSDPRLCFWIYVTKFDHTWQYMSFYNMRTWIILSLIECFPSPNTSRPQVSNYLIAISDPGTT